MFPIKRTVFLCTVTLVKNMVRLIGNIEYCNSFQLLCTCKNPVVLTVKACRLGIGQEDISMNISIYNYPISKGKGGNSDP